MADSPDTLSLPEFHPSRRAALAGIAGTLALATGAVGTVAVRSAHAEENADAKLIEVAKRLRAEWDLYDEMCVIVEDLPAKDADVYLAKVMDQLHVVDELTAHTRESGASDFRRSCGDVHCRDQLWRAGNHQRRV